MPPPRSALQAMALAWALAAIPAGAAETFPVDLNDYRPECGISVRQEDDSHLRISWDRGAGGDRVHLELDLRPGHPLIAQFGSSASPPITDADFATFVTVGTRVGESGRPPGMSPFNAFFDSPADRPHQTYRAELDRKSVRVVSRGRRTSLILGDVSAGPFTGTLQLTAFADSPLLLVETVLTTNRPDTAYLYDTGVVADHPSWESVGWTDTEGHRRQEPFQETAHDRPLAVRHRLIAAGGPKGSVACFPPPHRFFFARDFTDNLKTIWTGRGHQKLEPRPGFGVRQAESGGGRFSPWYNAPPGTEQRLGVFYLIGSEAPESAAQDALAYTHGDHFPELPGYRVFTSHWHLASAVAAQQEQARGGSRTTPEFVELFRKLGVNLVHLAEFHGDGHPQDPGPLRLPELATMFDECKRLSGPDLLFLPGEEANVHLRADPPSGNPGHWLYLFPRPVSWTMTRAKDQPFVETIDPFGPVYHVGNQDDLARLLDEEHGLAWTAHPRIKASTWAPDAYRKAPLYQSNRWLGAAWKAMPVDLSRERLGERGLDLLDDMNAWGPPKALLGEVDVFKLDHTHELYGHMNVNYLQLDRQPQFADDWSPILDALRQRRFFVTTGEVLLRDFVANRDTLRIELEWTFPLQALDIVSGGGADGDPPTRERIDLAETGAFGRQTWTLTPNLKGRRWVRVEAWDVAGDGAFSQTTWLDPVPNAGPPISP